jgi:hypothetical protein
MGLSAPRPEQQQLEVGASMDTTVDLADSRIDLSISISSAISKLEVQHEKPDDCVNRNTYQRRQRA